MRSEDNKEVRKKIVEALEGVQLDDICIDECGHIVIKNHEAQKKLDALHVKHCKNFGSNTNCTVYMRYSNPNC
jgi:hypothetical protein